MVSDKLVDIFVYAKSKRKQKRIRQIFSSLQNQNRQFRSYRYVELEFESN